MVGGNHFINAIRRNMDITKIVHDNSNIWSFNLEGQGSQPLLLDRKPQCNLKEFAAATKPISRAITVGYL